MNGAPVSEGSGGGEEEAGASYVELGQGGQEVLFLIAINRETCVMFLFLGSNNRLELPHVWRTTAGMLRTKGDCPNEQLSDCPKV